MISDWRGSTHDFVLKWKEQNRRYVAIVGTSQAIPSATKDHLLRNAVRSIPALKNIENMVTILEKGIGTTVATMTSDQRYERYKKLLISVCQTYDAKARSSRSRHCSTKPLLYQMQDPYENVFDVNMDVDMLMTYKTMRSLETLN